MLITSMISEGRDQQFQNGMLFLLATIGDL